MSISYQSNIGGLADQFRAEVDKAIAETKNDLDNLVNKYESDVRDFNTPSGPSHRAKYQEGALRRSVSLESATEGSVAVWDIAVGGADIDYTRYVSARDGVEFFKGSNAIEARGDEIMNEHWGKE